MNEFVLASNNAGKLNEYSQLLQDLSITLTPQQDYNIPAVDETGFSFVENALIKARAACKISQKPCIADDSGIQVDALQGAPGIYSARYAGEGHDDAANNQKLLGALSDVPEESRGANFYCVIVMLRHEHDPVPIICDGKWHGTIAMSAHGQQGFGYDPIFFLPDRQCTAAQLNKDEKNIMSHRAQAFHKLYEQLKKTHER